jgi:ABC-type spermidine/putrescine transport system permease subunit I
VLQVRDWPFASALSVWLMLIVIVPMILYRRFARATLESGPT